MVKMVTSFQGQRVTHNKTETAPVVSDYMTKKLITFHPDESMTSVMDKLMKFKISGGPVVDDNNELVGIISEGDCLKEIVKDKYHNSISDEGMVRNHMVAGVITIEPDVSILEAANKFLKLRIRRFPVLKNGELMGQISQKDIMKAVRALKKNTW